MRVSGVLCVFPAGGATPGSVLGAAGGQPVVSAGLGAQGKAGGYGGAPYVGQTAGLGPDASLGKYTAGYDGDVCVGAVCVYVSVYGLCVHVQFKCRCKSLSGASRYDLLENLTRHECLAAAKLWRAPESTRTRFSTPSLSRSHISTPWWS